MGRKLRIDGPGVWHNVSHRAAAHRLAFRDDHDKNLMWRLMAMLDTRFGVEVHALTLLDTHLHAVFRSREGRLSEAAQWLFSVYTKAFNRRHGINGALFQGRFWSEPITEASHLRNAIRYTHENVLDIAGVTDPTRYVWSSCRHHAIDRAADRWLHRLGVAYALRANPVLARNTAKRRSVRLRQSPPKVPGSVIRRAVAFYAARAEPFLSLDLRTGMFRARGPDESRGTPARRS